MKKSHFIKNFQLTRKEKLEEILKDFKELSIIKKGNIKLADEEYC